MSRTKCATEVEWTAKDDETYARLLLKLRLADEPGDLFDDQVRFVSLRDKAISLGMDVDPMPF